MAYILLYHHFFDNVVKLIECAFQRHTFYSVNLLSIILSLVEGEYLQ